MNRALTGAILFSILALTFPDYVLSSGDHGHSHSDNERTKVEKHQESGHNTGIPHNGEIEITGETLDGIQAIIVIQNRKEEFFHQGKQSTHRIIAHFKDVASGHIRENGEGAINFTADHDKAGSFEMMRFVDAALTAEVAIKDKGEVHFLLAAKLDKEPTRTYHFHAVFND